MSTLKQKEIALDVRNIVKNFKVSKKIDAKKKGEASLNNKPARGFFNLSVRSSKYEKEIKKAVDNISFVVPRGEIFGVVGPNGSGKSTLIRIISTLLYPDDGQVQVFGHDVIREAHAVRGLINRVSVDAAFFKKLSAYENLLYAARLYGIDDKWAVKRADEILVKLGFEGGRMTDPLEEMSRGMQQKIAIARALLTSPILLLLDEPTTGLDPRSKRDVQAFIQEVRDVHDATVLLTSHDMEEVDKLCNRVAFINDGKFLALDSPEHLKAMVEKTNGHEPTMDEVFLMITGKDWHAVVEEDAAKH
jgi:ABC-2 type transport system ATP-binding protein